jgi:hypothetical protein
MVSLTWIAGIVVILIGLALLIWQFLDVVLERSGVDVQFIVVIIVAIALVLIGAWLAKGGKVSISE